MRNGNGGFTLIELMIVVAIVGVLASIAVPQYQNYVGKAQLSEGISLASALKTAVTDANMNFGIVTGLNGGALGIPSDIAANAGRYVDKIETKDSVVTATFKTVNVASCVSGKTVTLTPTFDATGVKPTLWVCDSTVDASCKPSTCSG